MKLPITLSTLLVAVALTACVGQRHVAQTVPKSTTTTTVPSTTAPAPTTTKSTTTTTAPRSASTPAVSAPRFQFQQRSFACVPEPTPSIDRTWQVSAPRTPQSGVTSVPIGLRNKMAGSTPSVPTDPQLTLPAPDMALWAQLTTPHHTTYVSRTLRLLPNPPDSWITVSYPTDFPHATGLTPGTYTILWVTARGPLACDGFTVA